MADVADLGGIAHDILATALRVIEHDLGVRSQEVNLYLRKQPLPAGSRLAVTDATRELPIKQESLYVFADLAPLANWGHPARHLFFKPDDGKLIHSESSQFPPRDLASKPESFAPLHVPKVHTAPVTAPFFLPRHHRRHRRPPKRAGRRHAILFSGNSNNRHVNDLEFLFRVLCDVYWYQPDDIHVLNYDGTLNYNGGPQPVVNWPGDGTPYRMKPRIVGSGTRTDFDKLFHAIARRLKHPDTLVIHTNNHGGDASTYGEPWLCGYPNFALVYKASEFGERIASLPKCRSLIVGMEQCYSGGFMYPTLTNSHAHETSFAAAVPANLSSMGGPEWDPWAYSWIAAFNGKNPDGSSLAQPVVSRPATRPAFNYSFAVHVSGDDPVYDDAPIGVGATQHLD